MYCYYYHVYNYQHSHICFYQFFVLLIQFFICLTRIANSQWLRAVFLKPFVLLKVFAKKTKKNKKNEKHEPLTRLSVFTIMIKLCDWNHVLGDIECQTFIGLSWPMINPSHYILGLLGR
jgi:hypothetical protein